MTESSTLGEYAAVYGFARTAAKLVRLPCGDADCHVASLLAMTGGEVSLRTGALPPLTRFFLQHGIAPHVLAPAHTSFLLHVIASHVFATANTYPSSACHCEPVRTLVWQSVLLAVGHDRKQHFRRIRSCLRICPNSSQLVRLPCGDADCHVASLLAMTGGEVSLRTSALPPLTPGMFPRTLRPTSLHPRTRPSFCMSLRTSAHTGVAIRNLAGSPDKLASV